MTEIPEHLRKRRSRRAPRRRPRRASPRRPTPRRRRDPGRPGRVAHPRPPPRAQPGRQGQGRRWRGGRGRWWWRGGGRAAVRGDGGRAGRGRRRTPVGAGPGGHTQRLLTVVKSGSIQDVKKATPVDKVHTWPHLLAGEFVASLICLAFTFVFSVFVNAPLLQAGQARTGRRNPSKAPWYFLGLQGS